MGKNKQKDEAQENSGKKKGEFIILAVLILVVVGVGTFGGVYMYMQKNGNKEVKIEPIDYPLLSNTTLNLSDAGGRSYLKTSLTLSYDSANEDLLAELDKKKINLQDASLWYLKSKTADDFSVSKEYELKQGLIDTLNNILENGTILDVYLVGEDGTGFVVQKV
ncbi:MAG: flagellar basal body-associated FliL family protein [Clostridium sp.]|nr:flagellar basal body-associated FliL family protein [Clostridium sp.]